MEICAAGGRGTQEAREAGFRARKVTFRQLRRVFRFQCPINAGSSPLGAGWPTALPAEARFAHRDCLGDIPSRRPLTIIEPMYVALERWNVSANVAATLVGLLTDAEIAEVLSLLEADV